MFVCFPVPVCCVWSEKKESDDCTWELRVKHLSFTQQCFSVVLVAATSHVAFAFGVRVFPRSPV